MSHITTFTATTTVAQEVPAWRRILGVAHSEGKRLRRPTFAGVGLLAVSLFALISTFSAFMTADMAAELGGSLPMFGVVGDLAAADGIVAGVGMAADIIGIIMLALWAGAVASDYSTGWVRLTVAAEPRRWRLIAGKLVTLTGFTMLATTLATFVSTVVAPAAALATGVETSAWGTNLLPVVSEAWFNLTVVALVWGSIGFAVASVTRSAIAAIASGIGYLLVVEGMLTQIAEDVTTYLPGSVLDAVMAGGNDSIAYGPALVLAALVVAACVGVTTVVFSRRDVTS
jgi:ABC-2 type transport system permease protein